MRHVFDCAILRLTFALFLGLPALLARWFSPTG